jgi:ABC-type branched-subunit amino acid transport system permease subunit
MYTIRRITTATLALLSLAVVYLAVAATASAVPIEPGAGVQGAIPVPSRPTPTSIVVNNGSPWWTFVLVAVAGAAFAAATGLLVGRLRHARSGSARHNLVATSH